MCFRGYFSPDKSKVGKSIEDDILNRGIDT